MSNQDFRPLSPMKAGAFAAIALSIGLFAAACQEQGTPSSNSGASPASSPGSLKIGSLLPATGDLASVGQPMLAAVPLLVETVNQCGGVNGAPVVLVPNTDDQTD